MQYKRRTSILISVIFLIFILSCFSLLMPKKSAYALAETESDIISDGDVLSGLEKQKMYYEKLLVNTVENDELEKISNLLGTTEDIIEEYKNTNLNGRNASDSAAVASVISYFSNNNYVLAAELLTHMRDNKDLNSIYIPVNGSRVVGTTAFNNIIGSNYSFGSTTFSNDGSLLGTDAYFSLNKCAYRKASSGKAVVLTDRYDYDTSGYSWTIQGIAVKMMYNAQQSGYLTPFYTVITQEMIPGTTKPIPQTTIDINSTNSRNRFLEEVITLGKGDSKDFSITYEVGGMKVFQTFGNKDTILELYDSQGSLLLSNDDSGYKSNALISYDFLANTTYILRVKFYSTKELGDIKIVGTATNTVNNYEKIYSLNTAPSGELYTFSSVNKTSLYVYTPTSRNTYTLKLDGQVDGNMTAMYLYLIDPRSTVTIVSELYADSTYSPSQYSFNPPATIVKELAKDIPYLIIVSKSNMSSQALYNLSIK